MNVTPIRNPLAGEAVVDVAPPLASEVDVDWWRRRLNLFTGRALSDVALRTEQESRAGRLATLGQSVSAGVVAGLVPDVRVEVDADDVAYHELYVSSGLGIATSGEDVTLTRPLRVNVRDVPVYSTSEKVTAPTLGKLLDEVTTATKLPIAGVLVLQPAIAELQADVDPTDPCENDPQNDAYEDWQIVDGCRLVYFAWPEQWTLPVAGDRWRNRIARAIFDRERSLTADDVPPWSDVGIPIALAAFGADASTDPVEPWLPLFLDRRSVVRAGGRPRLRTALVPGSGNKFLWQARVEQFAEHMTDLGRNQADISTIAKEFRYVPPVGLLPKQSVDARAGVSRFFPSQYVTEAVPIPLEQLDTIVRAAASLRDFDLTVGDHVRVLVPVPQAFYEPQLLHIEKEDPAFKTALDKFLAARAEWLQRRNDVRAKAKAVVKALTGTPPEYPPPDKDPDALEQPEDVRSGALDPVEEAYGTEVAFSAVRAKAFDDLVVTLRTSPPWSTAETSATLEVLAPGMKKGGTNDLDPAKLPAAFKTRIRYDPARKLLFLTGVTTTEEREQLQAIPAADGAWETAIGDLHRKANADFNELYRVGVEGFIPYLEAKVDRADDHIDFGFLRVHTDIYRLRQFMLGNTQASRLATSPVLAGIAQGETALATRDDINKFFQATRGKMVTPPQEAGGTDAGYITYFRTLGKKAVGAAAFNPMLSGGARGGSLGGIHLATEKVTTGLITESGTAEPKAKSSLAAIEMQTSVGVLATQAATMDHITQQAAIVGEMYDFRTTSVAKRIETPPSLEAKSFSVASKYEVLTGLAALDLNLSDVPIAGLGGEATTFGAATREMLGRILDGAFDPNPTNGDEADFFGVGVKALDDAVVTLRAVEGRIQQYRAAIAMCRTAADTLREHATNIDRRLKQIADHLAEARHDVSVARALLAEEIARVVGVNKRRDEVIAEQVRFLAYCRPRAVEAIVPLPTRVVLPGLVAAPVPTCLSREVPVPSELRAMVDLLRDLPVRWYTHLPRLLEKFDRLDVLHGALLNAKGRANLKGPGEAAAITGIQAGGRLGQGVFKTFAAQQQKMAQVRLRTAQLDMTAFAGLGWQQSRDQAQDVLSLGDLLDAGHGRTDVAQAAARELEQIARVAACLYSGFGAVLPRIRLEWAERLSQYDEPVMLRNLATLPRWGDIEYLERREMQGLADWLYARVDPARAEAIAFINDLVRVCILLASHAPVSEIIAGHVSKPTVVNPGGRIELKVDLSKIRVGMHVLLYEQQHVVARGVVQDLASGLASAQVLETFRASVTLDAGARVQFSSSPQFGSVSLTGLPGGPR